MRVSFFLCFFFFSPFVGFFFLGFGREGMAWVGFMFLRLLGTLIGLLWRCNCLKDNERTLCFL